MAHPLHSADDMITKRPRRLAGECYVGYQRYLLTICTAFRSRVFESSTVVDAILCELRKCVKQFEFALIVYCFMPDHLHVLLTAQSERSDLRECARRFKQVSAFYYKKSSGKALWQPGYHERILRDDEATETVVRYILANPIRAGLTGRLGEYAFAGSDVYDLAGLLTAWENASDAGT